MEDLIIAEERLMAVRDRRVRTLLYVVGAVLIFGMGLLLLNEIYLHPPKVVSYRTQRIGWIGLASGLLTFALAYWRLAWAGAFFCLALPVIVDLAVLQGGLVNSLVVAYPLAVVLGSILLPGQRLLALGGYVLASYIFTVVAALNRWLEASPLPPSVDTNIIIYNVTMTVAVIVCTTLAMWFFSRTLYGVAAVNSARARQLQAALGSVQRSRQTEESASHAIGTVTALLGRIGERQLASANNQASSLAEVTATMEELSQTALQIADSASGVDRAATQSLAAVANSQAAVNDSLHATMSIRGQVQEIVERTVALNQRIQQIGEVVGVVSAIAAEIHLLALNAAIEAAGAGPSGGRFSIVAGEVKKLARRAQEEAKRIGSLVQEVQRANVMSVMATEQGLKETDKGAQQSREAAQANLELIDSVDSTSGQVRAITLATQQQRSATEQVVGTMRSLQDSAAQVADSSRELTMTLAQLNDLAAQLGGTDRTAAHYLPTGAASKGQD